MRKQAKLMQNKVDEMQDQLKQQKVEGSSGNGLIKITLDGTKKIIELKISPDCIDKDDVEGLQDLIISAYEKATEKLNDDDSMSNMPFHF